MRKQYKVTFKTDNGSENWRTVFVENEEEARRVFEKHYKTEAVKIEEFRSAFDIEMELEKKGKELIKQLNQEGKGGGR